MSEDRLMILRMLEEHKLTVEEALALLDALAKQETPDPNAKPSSKEADRSEDDLNEDVGVLISRIGKEIGEQAGKLGGILGEKLSGLSKLSQGHFAIDELRNITSGLSGIRQEVTQEFTGQIPAGDTPLAVSLVTRNGSLAVESWENDGYKIVAIKKVVATNADEAQQISANSVRVVAGAGGLDVVAHEESSVPSISLRAYLPAKLIYNLRLETTNGAIRVNQMQLEEAYWQTTNGSVRGISLTAKTLAASSTNGSIALEQSNINGLRMRTTNGSLHWRGASTQAELETTNGSVRLVPSITDECNAAVIYKVTTCNGGIGVELGANLATAGVQFNAKTHHGQIKPIGDWRILHERHIPGNREVSGESGGESAQLNLQLRSNNGSINLVKA